MIRIQNLFSAGLAFGQVWLPSSQFFRMTLRPAIWMCGLVLCGFVSGPLSAQEEGKKIYERQCASCHGQDGQGVEGLYEKPLGGERHRHDLLALVVDTMPEEEPESCVGQQAESVVEYIYERFYTAPKEAESSRLMRWTVPQHRNVLADIFATFAPRPSPIAASGSAGGRSELPPSPLRKHIQDLSAGGLLAEYYQSRGMNKADRLVIRRVDPRIEFDFQEGSPGPGITADQFSIIWDGSLLAPDTGYYDFRVTTENGARLYLNLDPQEVLGRLRDDSSASGQQALIDAWVGSGKQREETARVFLLGGRQYPLRFEFFKYQDESASVKLEWKPPHGTWSVLDASATRIAKVPRVFVCDVAFPADDRSLGFERGSSVSPEWHSAITNAAIAASHEAVARLPVLAGFSEDQDAEYRQARTREFLANFAARAFRRPLTDAERRDLIAAAFANVESVEAAVRRGVVMTLMSPSFLYPDLSIDSPEFAAYARATKLSLAMWDSLPDQELLLAAENGNLQNATDLHAQAERMLQDPRTAFKMRDFFQHWLEIEYRDLGKDEEQFPEFDDAVIADLRRSLEVFIEGVVWGPRSDYRELLLADYVPMNSRLREIYRPAADLTATRMEAKAASDLPPQNSTQHTTPTIDEFQPVSFREESRSGVLTHPYLLSAFAYHNNTSPIHRGVFLTRNIVGRYLNPPPVAIAFKDNEFDPHLTMREKVTELTRDAACMSCHSVINPLGFSLESFDAVGRWRTLDNNKPIDTHSEYTTLSGEKLAITTARDIANFAVTSPAAHQAFVAMIFQSITKQDPSSFDEKLLSQLTADFEDDGFHIRNLWARVATTAAAWESEQDSELQAVSAPTDGPSSTQR
ncbi:MAG: DUF1592 domain-containing protein [bacterium]|nr:DUF1592 domain-containing protein [bacterium]